MLSSSKKFFSNSYTRNLDGPLVHEHLDLLLSRKISNSACTQNSGGLLAHATNDLDQSRKSFDNSYN